ncbi:hypothetical protein F5X96DRAFT_437215 [Biscogniauxia mediterranea]|nr:hypothetical protein F5X96DRAFT_437215 [Biscogniauxia mediterranea]
MHLKMISAVFIILFYRPQSMDLEMTFTVSARERTLADWKTLFEEAGSAFVLKNVLEPKGSALRILEFVWKGRDRPTE